LVKPRSRPTLQPQTPADRESTGMDSPVPSMTFQMIAPSGDPIDVPLTGEPGLDLTKVAEAQVFKDWASNVDKDEKLFIEKVHVQSLDMFGPRVGFIKFVSTAKVHVGGEKGVINVPGIVFMRGGAVSAVPRPARAPRLLSSRARVAISVLTPRSSMHRSLCS
jgi:hypothetical protein